MEFNFYSAPVVSKSKQSSKKANIDKDENISLQSSVNIKTVSDLESELTTDGMMKSDLNNGKFGSRKNPKNKIKTVTEGKGGKFKSYGAKNVEKSGASDHIYASSKKSSLKPTLTTFTDLGLSERLMSTLAKSNNYGKIITKPTKVQSEAIPLLMTGVDVLIKSETGSGKTLCYLLPIVQRLADFEPKISRSDGTYAIVMAPTRELVQQIYTVLQRLTYAFQWIVPGIVSGGEKKKAEKSRLRKGVTILIATPGRLLDHLQSTKSFNIEHLKYFVLDEADRLLDLGFRKQLVEILDYFNGNFGPIKQNPRVSSKQQRKRQNVLISATMNEKIEELVKLSLYNPVYCDVDSKADLNRMITNENGDDEAAIANFQTPKQLVQVYVETPLKLRLVALVAFLRRESQLNPRCKAIIFMSTCDSVDFHYELLRNTNWPNEEMGGRGRVKVPGSDFCGTGRIYKLHGNIKQSERLQTFREFCTSESGIILCTDVAARGLDLPSVNWIVQYDPPNEPSEYVHRVGRTCRAGTEGHAVIFLLPSEVAYLQILARHGNIKPTPLDMDSFFEDAVFDMEKTNKYLPVNFAAQTLQKTFQNIVSAESNNNNNTTNDNDKSDEPSLKELAEKAFGSYLRAYATHSKETKSVFHVRGLHFGHVARSFALKEPPAKLGAISASHRKDGDDDRDDYTSVDSKSMLSSYKKRKLDIDIRMPEKTSRKQRRGPLKRPTNVSEFF